MLGPVDLRDWDCDEADLLRADIRSLPIVLRHAREPKVMAGMLGKDVCRRLGELQRGALVEIEELRRLLGELRLMEASRR